MRYLSVIVFLFLVSNAFAEELKVADKATYQVKIVQTMEEKLKGLMFVKKLPENQGMLFDFRGYSSVAMWMKNTYISLDMLFIDCNFKVADMHQNATPLSLEKISTDKPFCFVLEINGGQVLKQNISIGDKITVSLPEN